MSTGLVHDLVRSGAQGHRDVVSGASAGSVPEEVFKESAASAMRNGTLAPEREPPTRGYSTRPNSFVKAGIQPAN